MRIETLQRGIVLYGRLLEYLKPQTRVFLTALAALGAVGLTEPLVPLLLKTLVDKGFGAEVTEDGRLWIWLLPLLLLLLFVVRGGLSYIGTVAINWVGQRLVMDLRQAMFCNLVTLPSAFFDNHASGELTSKFTFDATQVSTSVTRGLDVFIKDGITVIALVCTLLALNTTLALIFLLTAPPVGWVVYRVSRLMREMSRRVQAAVGDMTHISQETIAGQREVKIFAGHQYEIQRFERASDAVRKYQMKVVKTAAANVPVIQFIMAIGLAGMMYLALGSGASGMQAGGFVAFLTTVVMLLPPTKRLASINEHLQRGLAAAESLFGLIDHPHETAGGQHPAAKVRGALRFSDVRYSYPGNRQPALTGVSFNVAPGQTVALVGASGAGKTTLANLLPRLYEPGSGQIFLDDMDVTDVSLYWLRAQISMVSQQVVLFNDTLYNNVAYGALRDCAKDEVMAAIAAAHVDEFAANLAEGVDTMIGNNGVRLSGGQRQRIAIARALLKNAPVLILDEATSALDSEAEKYVQDALTRLRVGRTSLVIAHRLSTIESADRIVVLEQGKAVEQGTHAQLLSAGGAYARLHQCQFDGGA
ncbi:MAG: lipid A export permease/ATP-binding protein MsbA [Gammaproteobacteria bacterium]|nr:lipid A export permease/ATP-binding protein MsbA [Gammaproteobacteria bacterium]